MTGSPLNTNVNVGAMEPSEGGSSGDGSVRTDLRGVATLVLLYGRRFPNGGSGADSSVDLNTLPVSWIDRVEVLSGGASAVYGADAVGGHPEMTRKCPEP
jgi:iron complex outermembrane receptor protein